MESLLHYRAPPSQCGYLPDEVWRLEYQHVSSISAAEYMQRMVSGWRRFGHVLFRPRCRSCSACRSLRVLTNRFQPDRSQRRSRKTNEDVVRLEIGVPSVSDAKLTLYDRYHAHQAEVKGWPVHPAKDPDDYASSFVDNPFPTQEWCYFLGQKLVAVGYVDDLPGGLSAIYFYYDPDERWRSLGTWNILCILQQAARRSIPHVYLGYYVEGCPSMTYKCRFTPNQILGLHGRWHDFQT
jgi:arginine-tRNA-protein transferase